MPTAGAVLATSNGRFDALPGGLQPAQELELVKLAERQRSVGAKAVPVLSIWGVDVATEAQLDTLVDVVAHFLAEVHPTRLMLSGRRAVAVADRAELVLRRVLAAPEGFKPSTLVSGGADGVDSVALRLVNPSVCPGLTVIGQHAPTPFARADIEGKLNPRPVALTGLQPGPSPLQREDEMGPMPAPGLRDAYLAFLALLEGQWEARDTHNAELADACLAFLTNEKRAHDGIKATMNIFAEGRYAHFGGAGHWEADGRSSGVEKLAKVETEKTPDGKSGPHVNVVGYKLLRAPPYRGRDEIGAISSRQKSAFLEGTIDDDDKHVQLAADERAALQQSLRRTLIALTSQALRVRAVLKRSQKGQHLSTRSGYLRTLEELIGPSPSSRNWKDEWVDLGVAFYKQLPNEPDMSAGEVRKKAA